VAVSLLLERVHLEAGEPLYVPAGVPHAYLRGTAVEIMAASDNVLRAGLSPKHVDAVELLAHLDYSDVGAARVPVRHSGGVTVLTPPVADFALVDAVVAGLAGIPLAGPRILVALEGSLEAATEGQRVRVGRGDGLFIEASEGQLTLLGRGRAVIAAPGSEPRDHSA
jgi:mannose-6-phosphate isomerase